MATLETLPAPLPLYILKLLPDLKALDSLTRSSLVFMNVLAQHAAEVLEYLMHETLFDDIAVEIRVYILILIRGKTQANSDIEALYSQARCPLPRTTPSAAIFHTLRLFSYLSSVCDAILNSKLDRLKTLPHEHIAPDHRSHWPIAPSAIGIPYAIQDPLSPPSFIEQQRMLRAIWRVQIHRKSGSPAAFPAPHRTDDEVRNWQADEVDEVAASLDLLGITGDMGTDCSVPLVWDAMPPMPLPASASKPSDIAWCETREDTINRYNKKVSAYAFFHTFCRRFPRSPLRDADWTILRRLGLGIWSERRMAEELELTHYPRSIKPYREGHSCYEHGVDQHLAAHDRLFTMMALYRAEIAAAEGTEKT